MPNLIVITNIFINASYLGTKGIRFTL
jgi:hypothetical protein